MKTKKTKRVPIDITFKLPPLPSAKDKLFDSGDDWWHNACLNYLHDQWLPYVIGYKKAADILVRHIKQTRRYQDTLVYPIIFLYRQYLELAIKNLIYKGRILQNIESPDPTGHNIYELWRVCEKLLSDISPGDSVEELKQIGRLISEFCFVDPKATAFRYPKDKDGKASLPNMKHINVRNIYDVMEKVSVILEGADMQLTEYLSIKAEMESEYYEYNL
jgi:hypothetical protein